MGGWADDPDLAETLREFSAMRAAPAAAALQPIYERAFDAWCVKRVLGCTPKCINGVLGAVITV